jgi:hypothetical protein
MFSLKSNEIPQAHFAVDDEVLTVKAITHPTIAFVPSGVGYIDNYITFLEGYPAIITTTIHQRPNLSLFSRTRKSSSV